MGSLMVETASTNMLNSSQASQERGRRHWEVESDPALTTVIREALHGAGLSALDLMEEDVTTATNRRRGESTLTRQHERSAEAHLTQRNVMLCRHFFP